MAIVGAVIPESHCRIAISNNCSTYPCTLPHAFLFILVCSIFPKRLCPLKRPCRLAPNMTLTTPTRNILGPLTTTFTAPSRCTEAMLQSKASGSGWLAQTCQDGHMADDASCWPSPVEGVSVPVTLQGGWGVYSPGLICPASHTTACHATAGVQGGFDFQFPLSADETAVGCCPRYVR